MKISATNTIALNKNQFIIKSFAYIFGGVILLSACSQFSIPLDPIPITLQTVAVMLVGLIFKRSNAIKIILIYLALGAIGVPIFANFKSGMQCLLGPSGGYLWGFLIAVIIMSSIKKYLNKRNTLHIALNCLLGTTVILFCGVLWLAYYVELNTAVKSGLYPFIAGGIIKIIFATVIVRISRFNDYYKVV